MGFVPSATSRSGSGRTVVFMVLINSEDGQIV
uniref:Uncharacterized protein n=1 Tax=Myoviridae sp. ctU4n16 TaxID=2826658 RepID=A0A8S5N5C7_9CAUD|nr:MAG TPA: hypothetical protein [Myoviridae sp. ctU4n16]